MEDSNNHQPVSSPTPAITPTTPFSAQPNPGSQQDKPKIKISDSEAQALLLVQNLQTSQGPKRVLPAKLLIITGILVTLVILASFLLGAIKPSSNSPSTSPTSGLGIPNQTNTYTGSGTSSQINQDVKACANPVNAMTVC
jgi:hypothetical protein